jgi:hypothetical protein
MRCEAGRLVKETCDGGKICQENVCGSGARCCQASDAQATCQRVGTRGVCEGNVALWCDEQGVLHDANCSLLPDRPSCGTCTSIGVSCCP